MDCLRLYAFYTINYIILTRTSVVLNFHQIISIQYVSNGQIMYKTMINLMYYIRDKANHSAFEEESGIRSLKASCLHGNLKAPRH